MHFKMLNMATIQNKNSICALRQNILSSQRNTFSTAHAYFVILFFYVETVKNE